jgi:hypothetical protein
MDAALPWSGHEEPAELPELAANDRSTRTYADFGGMDQGGGWIGTLLPINAIIALIFATSSRSFSSSSSDFFKPTPTRGMSVENDNENPTIFAKVLCLLSQTFQILSLPSGA